MKKAILLVITLAVYITACQPAQQEEKTTATEAEAGPTVEKRSFPGDLSAVLKAHGGYESWAKMNQLSYTLTRGESSEKQLIALKNRKVLLTATDHTIGFDGSDAWISPSDAKFGGSPRFYHNLYFYFFAMPFVLSDPGINYSEAMPFSADGTDYPGIKISYNEGIGDSPKDNYILYYDPETYQMKYLMYTVTYRSQETSEKYNLIKYDDWKSVNGLLLPSKLAWYTLEEGKIGEMRSEVLFSDLQLSPDIPSDEIFTKPEDAKVDVGPEGNDS